MAGVLADATAFLHFMCLLYIGLGGFLGWRNPKTLLVHMFFAAWGVLVLAASLPCPLTALQDYLRRLQGLGSLPGGFNEYYIYGDLIPRAWLPAAAVIAFLLLIASYVGTYLLHRRRAREDDTAADTVSVGRA